MKDKKYLWVIVVLILVVIDQVIKYLVLKHLDSSSITLINNVLELTYAENTRMSFSLRF